MRIAVPVADGRLAAHFGHCESFAMMEVDPESSTLTAKEMVAAPPHEPGLLPGWLAARGADVIIAGGMGVQAQKLFAVRGIRVVVGAPAREPEAVALAFMNGTLSTGDNLCDH